MTKSWKKGPVRVLTPFQWNGTKKHWEPHRNRGYHLKSLFLLLLLFFFSIFFFFFFFGNKIIRFDLNDKIMGKGACEGVDTILIQ